MSTRYRVRSHDGLRILGSGLSAQEVAELRERLARHVDEGLCGTEPLPLMLDRLEEAHDGSLMVVSTRKLKFVPGAAL
jgi:hypothetical protein